MTIDKLDPKGLEAAALNTDREIWRERPGDYYADSIRVTASGGIGIDCGGLVYTLPVREWHRLAGALASTAGVPGETPRVTEDSDQPLTAMDRLRLHLHDPETFELHSDDLEGVVAEFEALSASLSSPPVSQQAEAVAVTCDEDSMPERIWAGDFNWRGFGHCVIGQQGGLYAEYVRADLAPPAPDAVEPLEYGDEQDPSGRIRSALAHTSPVSAPGVVEAIIDALFAKNEVRPGSTFTHEACRALLRAALAAHSAGAQGGNAE